MFEDMFLRRDQAQTKRIKSAVSNGAWTDTFLQLQAFENSF